MSNFLNKIRDMISGWFGTGIEWPQNEEKSYPEKVERPEEWPLYTDEKIDNPEKIKEEISHLQQEIKELKEMQKIFDGE